MKSKSIKKLFLIIGASIIMAFMLVFSGLAIANAENNGEDAIVIPNPFETLFAPANVGGWPVDGLEIYKDDLTPAVSPTDYEYNSAEADKQITLKTDGLIIKGTTLAEPGIDVCFLVNSGVRNLTLENLYIGTYVNHNAFNFACSDGGTGEYNFTLNIKGKVYVYQWRELPQNPQPEDKNVALNFSDGSTEKEVNITGAPGSYLECYSASDDTIRLEKSPVKFSGSLETLVLSEYGDGIDWGEAGEKNKTNTLTISDHATLEIGNDEEHNDTAIYAGNINVVDSGNLYAINFNEDSNNLPAVYSKGNFLVDTYGEVIVDAYNDRSWQAIVCTGDMTINKCWNFIAIAQDFTALEVLGNLTINTPNVYLSGCFEKNKDFKAWRGAFAVSDMEKLHIAPWIEMYGSKDHLARDCYDIPYMTFTSGKDIIEDSLYKGNNVYRLFTPVLLERHNANTVAKTVMFKNAVFDVIEIPGHEPTYEYGGFKSCYMNINSGQYFEDYWQTMPIENYALWVSVGDGYLPPLKYEFNSYRDEVKANCDLMLVKGDIPEVRALIDAAKANIDAYQYDNALSFDQNKTALDSILIKLAQDIAALPIPGGGGDDPYNPQPVNPDVPGGGEAGGGAAATGDSMPMGVVAGLSVLAAIACGVVIRKRWQ